MTLFSALYWREPLWMLLALLPVIVAALRYKNISSRRQQLVDADLLPWVQAKPQANTLLASQLLSFTAWLMMVLALSGPRTPSYIPPELAPPSAELIVISDLSGSMEATDTLIDGTALRRRDAVIPVIEHWNDQAPGNLDVGLIIVAGHPHWLLKPSHDPQLRKHIIKQLKTVQAPTLGNDLAAALEVAAQTRHSADTPRRIVLFTDGDIEAAQRQRTATSLEQLLAESKSLSVTLVGVGANELSRLSDGNTTRLESIWLKQLGEKNRVRYLTLQQAYSADLAELLQIPSPRIAPSAKDQILWAEWFALPLVTALLLIVLVFNLRRRHA